MTTSAQILPPAPVEPKKSHPWRTTFLVLLGLFAVGVVLQDIGGTSTPQSVAPVESAPVDAVEDVDMNMEIARLTWIDMTTSDQDAICDYYNTPPVGVTSEMVRIFDDGANLGYAESERVLSTLLAEEC